MQSTNRFTACVVLCLGAIVCAATMAAATVSPRTRSPRYRLIDLGAINVWGMNDKDEVVGAEPPSPSALVDPLVWRSGHLITLPLPPTNMNDPFEAGGSSGIAHAVNNRGTIAGEGGPGRQIVMSGLVTSYGILWKSDAVAVPRLTGPSGSCSAINQLGDTVGSDSYRGFTYISNVKREIGTLSRLPGGNGSFATGINDLRDVVGCSTVGNGNTAHAFLLRNGRMTDLGGIRGDTATVPAAINNRGEIVGYSTEMYRATPLIISDSPHRAFVWRHGRLRRLPGLPGAQHTGALAINDSGWIVGESGGKATLWIHDVPVDLNRLVADTDGLTLTRATAINRFGHIAGIADVKGERHGFLLIPGPSR